MLTVDLILMLLAVADGAILSWLPVREWVQGPIPERNTANQAIRAVPHHVTVIDPPSCLKATNPHSSLRMNMDRDELTIQLNQYKALNILSEECLSSSYYFRSTQTPPPTNCIHLQCHNPCCDHENRDTGTDQQLNNPSTITSLDEYSRNTLAHATILKLKSPSNQHHHPSQPYSEQYRSDPTYSSQPISLDIYVWKHLIPSLIWSNISSVAPPDEGIHDCNPQAMYSLSTPSEHASSAPNHKAHWLPFYQPLRKSHPGPHGPPLHQGNEPITHLIVRFTL